MIRIQWRWTGILAIAGVALVGVACTNPEAGITKSEDIFRAILINDATNNLPIHILAPEESFSSGNQLQPGSSRTVIVEIPGLGVTFRAGRDANVLGSIICTTAENNEEDGIVLWVQGALVCAGAFRS